MHSISSIFRNFMHSRFRSSFTEIPFSSASLDSRAKHAPTNISFSLFSQASLFSFIPERKGVRVANCVPRRLYYVFICQCIVCSKVWKLEQLYRDTKHMNAWTLSVSLRISLTWFDHSHSHRRHNTPVHLLANARCFVFFTWISVVAIFIGWWL